MDNQQIFTENTVITEEKTKYKFDAFISYRHAELDSAVAGYLQKSLERYKIPKEIQKKIGKSKIDRVFRDEEELGASSDLFGQIEDNLKQSEFLIVICSPRFKESKWCLKEIETFIKYHGTENILAVLIEGDPYDVFPAQIMEGGEPLAVDLRGNSKKEVLKQAKERMPRLVAPLLHCSYDELYQRHRVYKMRRLVAASVAVAAVSLLFGGITIKQNKEITANFLAKQENQSRYLAKTSEDLISSGNRDSAILVALEALPESADDNSRPYVAEARIALENALYTYNVDYYFTIRPQKDFEMKADFYNSTDYNEADDVLLTLDAYGRVYLWDCKTADNLLTYEEYLCEEAEFAGSGKFIGKTASSMFCYNYKTNEIVWEWDFPVCPMCNTTYFKYDYTAESNKIVCANRYLCIEYTNDYTERELTDSHKFYCIDAITGESSNWIIKDCFEENGVDYRSTLYDLKLSPDGRHLAFLCYWMIGDLTVPDIMDCRVYAINGDTAVLSVAKEGNAALSALHWIDNERIVSVTTDDDPIALGLIETPFEWEVNAYNISSGETLFSHRDSSLSLDYKVQIENYISCTLDDIPVEQLSVICGNVQLCMDRNSGEIYSRIEDRRQIKMAQVLPNQHTELVITSDGFVFVTNPYSDQIFSDAMTAYQYHLDLGIIDHAVRYNNKTYIFCDSKIYWYQDSVDENLTYTEGTPNVCGFSPDAKYMYYVDYDSMVHLYDTDTKEHIYSDTSSNYEENTVVMSGNNLLCYPSAFGGKLCVYDIENGKKSEYLLENQRYSNEKETEFSIRKNNTHSTVVTLWDNARFYTPNSFKDLEYRLDQLVKSVEEEHTVPPVEFEGDYNLMFVADAADGSIKQSFRFSDLLLQLDSPDDVYSIVLNTVTLSGDEKFILIPGVAEYYIDSEYIEKPFFIIFDTEKQQFISLPEECIDNLHPHISCYTTDSWILPDSSIILLYGYNGNIQIVDIANAEILHELVFNATGSIGSSEISFTPDGDHIIFQDAAMRLKVYNWKKGVFTQEEAVPKEGSLNFTFYNDGQFMSAELTVSKFASSNMLLYDKTADGVYTLQNTINSCIGCNGKTVLISDDSCSRIYDMYTFDDLINMAKEYLDGKELTEAEKQTYLTE